MTTVSRSRPRRKPGSPAAGTFRWVVQPGLYGSPGLLLITVTRADGRTCREFYTIAPNTDGGKLLGWRLTKSDRVTTYDVEPGTEVWDCSCPDFTLNRAHADTADLRGCKHGRCLKAALALLEA